MNKEKKNIDIVQLVPQMYDKNPELAFSIFSPSCIHHINGTKQESRGPEFMKTTLEKLNEENGDFKTSIIDSIAVDDKVAFRWSWQATHRASGMIFTIEGNTIFKFKDGLVEEVCAQDNRYQVMINMGFQLVPPSAHK